MIIPGDKVRFLNENMEGIVTSLLGKNLIGVTVDNDFEIPVLLSEVVKVGFQEKSGNLLNPISTKGQSIKSNHALGIFLAFERIGETDLNIHLHNNFSESLFVLIYQRDRGVCNLQKSLTLQREETTIIGKSSLNDFEKWLTYEFVLLPFDLVTVSPSSSIFSCLTFKAKTFHGYWKHCDFLSKQAYVFRLDEPTEKLDLNVLKEKDFGQKQEIHPVDLKAKPTQVIDLHYESLKANGYGHAADITSFQMDVFVQTLEAGFVHHLSEIIYIHGIGNAYLKNKIRTYLTKHPELVSKFEDADMLKYGGGATIVQFK